MRRRRAEKRDIVKDLVYNSVLVSKIINKIMWDGKKSTASKIFYDAMDMVKEKTGQDSIEVLMQAIENITPKIEVRPRRVGGATYQVPVEVRVERQRSLSIRWLVNYARLRSERTMAQKLAGEIIDAANNRGGSVKKKEDTHKMAEANRAFAHYRW